MYDIAIIDSGVNLQNNNTVDGVFIRYSVNKIVVECGNISDDIGHGTVIYQMIKKYSPKSKIFVVKIIDGSNIVDEHILYYALKYIKDNIRCRAINMSLGLKICNEVKKFRELCAEIINSGTIIVSAFDNDNCFSYPACFPEVIGVDNNEKIKHITDYEYVESSPVNIRAKGSMQRIKLENNKIIFIDGTSIACAYITAYIVDSVKEHELSHKVVLEYLKNNAAYIYENNLPVKKNADISVIAKMKNVAVFPVSKEAHAFIRFNDMLHFSIRHYYDIRHSGRVGAKINKFCDTENEMYIEDINNANFEDIDTIILGHLDEINELLGYDIREKLINIANLKSINIYSFDALFEYSEGKSNRIFFPSVCKNDVQQNTFGKLYKINKPVVGIFGTSSKQGKFSLQLTLKRIFEESGYRVGCIGTEPHSLLFNMDCVYPMGYSSSVCVSPWQSITFLNEHLNKLCEEDVEIIFVASQAGSASQNFNNIIDYPIKQNTFLMGTHPDAIILCINIYDEISYIRNSIQVLQGLSDSEVIALVLYPINCLKKEMAIYNTKFVISFNEYEQVAKKIYKEFGLPVYLLGDLEQMKMLYQKIIDFF